MMWKSKSQGYYFYSEPNFSVIYFGQDDSVIKTHALRTLIGIKLQSDNDLICYYYGITKAEAKSDTMTRSL